LKEVVQAVEKAGDKAVIRSWKNAVVPRKNDGVRHKDRNLVERLCSMVK